jgi:hypothetical protein
MLAANLAAREHTSDTAALRLAATTKCCGEREAVPAALITPSPDGVRASQT